MKRMFFTGSVFFLAVLFGVGFTMFVAPVTQADECDTSQGPFLWLSCETGPSCSGKTPWYVYDCEGVYYGTNDPCNCVFFGCHGFRQYCP